MLLKKLLEQRNRSKSLKERAEITLEIASQYAESGDHESALDEYTILLELRQSQGDRFECCMTHRLLADCCIELNQFDLAITHTNRYLKLSVELDNKLEQQRAYVTLGRCFLNRCEHLKDGDRITTSLKSAGHAFLNSIKLIGDLSSKTLSQSSEQLAEMRAISLLNLGQVLRAQRDHKSANERFVQCVSLARKYNIRKLLFRACYQLSDMLLTSICLKSIDDVGTKADVLNQCDATTLKQAKEIVSLALRSPLTKSCTDTESKDLLRSVKETYANILLGLGRFRQAAKVFRLLKLNSPVSSDICRDMIRKSMLLNHHFQSLPELCSFNAETHTGAARTHERLGDIYASIDLHGPALRHYQWMLSHAQHARRLLPNSDNSDESLLTSTNKLVDAALISVAETFRAMGDYSACVDMYKREIQWVVSCGLPTGELAGSWFSLAQAQRLIQHQRIMDTTNLLGASDTVESLNSALTAAKQSGLNKLIIEILTELEDYHASHHHSQKAVLVRQELSIFKPQSSEVDQEDSSSTSSQAAEPDQPSDEHDDVVNHDEVTTYMDALSSDSEVESCIGCGDLLDEFRVSSRGARKGKALCLKTNMKGETPLHIAAINGDMDHVVKLVELLAHPVNIADGAGWLPIHEAAFHDRTEIAVYLLDRGAYLDDPGCPLDASTPLFEAVVNSSLATALIFVRRGANLWHRNKRNECLPELLDLWQPTRRRPGSFSEQRALFEELLSGIRECLGADYDKWCNQPRSDPSLPSNSDSSSPSPPTSPLASIENIPRRTMKRPPSPSLTMLDDTESDWKSMKQRHVAEKRRVTSIRGATWDDLLVDLDASESRKPRTKKMEGSGIESYKEAMQAVAGSSSRKRKSLIEHKSSHTAAKRRLSSSTTHIDGVIDVNDDKWLVPDEPCCSTSKKQPKFSPAARDQFETMNVRKPKSRPNPMPPPKIHIKPPVSCDSDDLEFAPHTDTIFNSTQIETKDKKREIIMHHPTKIPPPTNPARTVTQSSTEYAGHIPASSQPVRTVSAVNIPFSVKIAFTDISFLVPVDDSSRNVAWLASEAYRRRQILLPSTTILPQFCIADSVRLSTRDGALLLPTDRLHSVIHSLGHSNMVIELLAEVIVPPNSNPHLPAGIPDPVLAPPVEQRSSVASGTGYVIPDSDKQTRLLSSRFFKKLIERSRCGPTNTIDLRFLALGDTYCNLILNQLHMHGVRAVNHLHLQGNRLSCDPRRDLTSVGLVDTIVRLAPHLNQLDLSFNLLNMGSLTRLFDRIQSVNDCGFSSRSPLFPRLDRLNLAHNPLHMSNTDGGEDDNLIGWSRFVIDRLIPNAPRLTSIDLSNCWLSLFKHATSMPSNFSSSPVCALSELDISWNGPLDSDELYHSLSSNSMAGLRSLKVRGCSSSKSVSLPLNPTQWSASTWLRTKPVKTSSFGTPPSSIGSPSHGDQIVKTLVDLMEVGHFRLQSLDLGHCQLTTQSLNSLGSLFTKPGTSLTTICLDYNPDLFHDPVRSGWPEIVNLTASASSALVSLCIDLPEVNKDDVALESALNALKSKLVIGQCPTPLQQLILIGAPSDWRPSNTSSTLTSISNAHRFCCAVETLFQNRFGSLSKTRCGPNRITFGIL